MQSRWNDISALDAVETYAAKGVSEDVALRIYTTRLLGRDPLLVLHGGGNTSVKTRAMDDLGHEHEVLCVKGSGWDMAEIEPPGLPAVKLEPLRKLRALDALSDEDMVNFQRLNLLDAAAPNPSVETLLHAFLPHKFIDHTHAAAVLAWSISPTARRLRARSTTGAWASCPTSRRASGWPRPRPKCSSRTRRRRPDPAQARHLHLRRDGARGLRAHDRDGVARRERLAPGAAASCSRRARCRRACRGRRDRADHPRRLRASGRRAGGEPTRFVLDLPHRARDPHLRRTAPSLPTTASAAW